MDKELIERLAKEAGALSDCIFSDVGGERIFRRILVYPFDQFDPSKFAALVAEECAKIAESDYLSMLATQTAHYRQSPTPFDQSRFGFQPDAIGAGRRAAGVIRTKFPAPANTPVIPPLQPGN